MNIQEHYEKRRELDLLEQYDNTRKHLIRLAIMRVVALSGPKTSEPQVSDDLEQLINRCHNYELTINKLKQDWNTKEKLSESRIEKLKDDLAKARQQLKEKSSMSSGLGSGLGGAGTGASTGLIKPRTDFQSRTNFSFNTSPYLKRPMGNRGFLSPTASSRNRGALGVGNRNNNSLFSPVIPKPGEKRGRYLTASKIKQMNQIQGLGLNGSNMNTSNQQTPKSGLNSRLNLDKAITNKVSPTKSPSRLSFIENFDKSDPSKSPSPDFTPTKTIPSKFSLQASENILPDSFGKTPPSSQSQSQSQQREREENEEPDANSTALNDDSRAGSPRPPGSQLTNLHGDQSSGVDDDDDVFASANSSLGNSSVISKGSQERAKGGGKTKLLNLAGSLKGNTQRTVSRGLNIEQDGVNSLDYYKDTNFTEGNDESPNQKRHQPIEARAIERKKKKVFKVT